MLSRQIDDRVNIATEVRTLIAQLGSGHIASAAYETAWVARLAPQFPEFEASLEWLRQNQHPDGTWGSAVFHAHDRFLSTLAALVALKSVGQHPRDPRRIQRGEDALWRVVGKLSKDDHDTVGFPLLSAALTQQAAALGLDVPNPPIRFAKAYQKKVNAVLNTPDRDLRTNPLVYSLEGLLDALTPHDNVFEANHSISVSPSATAAFLLKYPSRNGALGYLQETLVTNSDGGMAQFNPLDVYEVAWALNHLRLAGAITPDDPIVRDLLNFLAQRWSPQSGATTSTYSLTYESDNTSAVFTLLRWGGYDVSGDVFYYYETDDHFCCYRGETNPSVSAMIRTLAALRFCVDHPDYRRWVAKIVDYLHKSDQNGSFWTDKWHISPYYVTSIALNALRGIDENLARTRLKWILRTQNDDGGWGYHGTSTPEETAYCLEGLIQWDQTVERVPPTIIDDAARYLRRHTDFDQLVPLWIGKTVYTPTNIVKAAILGALFAYENWKVK